jgi:hypothetical protein
MHPDISPPVVLRLFRYLYQEDSRDRPRALCSAVVIPLDAGRDWNMKWYATLGGLSVMLGLAISMNMNAGDPPVLQNRREVPQSSLMLAKLASTQQVVSGLVSKDFNMIKRAADDLQRICEASQWESHPDPAYASYKSQLSRHANKLAEMAQQQNLEGTTLVYMQTVSACVDCHSHCRDVLRIAAVPQRVISIPVTDEMSPSSMPVYRR